MIDDFGVSLVIPSSREEEEFLERLLALGDRALCTTLPTPAAAPEPIVVRSEEKTHKAA